jgi:uncharacterized repeat protein (TIGR04076 family)
MNEKLDLNINLGSSMAREDYFKNWESLYKIEIKLAEKVGECKHNAGDVFYYENPYKRPENVCFALLHVLDLYTWRVTFGFPSWNEKARDVFRIHCPDHTGTIWEMRRVKK